MGFGGGGANESRQEQLMSEIRMRIGAAQLNKIFDGGMSGTGAVTNPLTGQKYYSSSGSEFVANPNDAGFQQWLQSKGMGLGKGQVPTAPVVEGGQQAGNRMNRRGGTAAAPAGATVNPLAAVPFDQQWLSYLRAQANMGNLFSGTEKKGGFGEDFYSKRATDYERFALPKLGEQFREARGQAQYKLANQGLLRGSGAKERIQSSLLREMNTQKQAVADEALNQKNALRQQVEDSRSRLLSQLYATEDPTSVMQSAARQANAFTAPSGFAPLGNAFANWTNTYLAGREVNAINNAMDRAKTGSLPSGWQPSTTGAVGGLIDFGKAHLYVKVF